MTDTGPSVALLFDDTALVAQLRDALHACGARIVHEGGVASLDRDRLRKLDADVLVINLDDAAADALDSLYALVGGDRPRLVFNDAEASAALTGWDRARWARHLAVKIFQAGEIDPPRPAGARAVEVPTPAPEDTHGAAVPPAAPTDAVAVEVPGIEPEDADRAQAPVAEAAGVDAAAVFAAESVGADDMGVRDAGSADADGADISGAGPPVADGEEIPPAKPDGADGMEIPAVEPEDADGEEVPMIEPTDAGGREASAAEPADTAFPAQGAASRDGDAPAVADAEANATAQEAGVDAEEMRRSLVETQALSAELEALLASAELLDGGADDADGDGAGAAPGLSTPDGSGPADGSGSTMAGFAADDRHSHAGDAADPLAAPAMGLDDLLDVLPMGQEPVIGSAPLPGGQGAPELPSIPAEWALVDDDEIVAPATFGVEKQSAAEFLAPEAELMTDADEPVLNLELVSLEEAVAPGPPREDVEMHLDELHLALSRLVLTGATLGGSSAALAFYAALPATTQVAFLHTQHLRGQSVADLVAQLAGSCRLKVVLAADGASTRPGEVLVVPPGCRVRVRRDAGVDVQAWGDELLEPSIDESFRMAAEAFGRDALAIVFAGHSDDAIAGSKAVHAAGGRVWVETAAPEYADMVHEISGAGVVEYSGTPEEMATRLAEKFA